jgi:hypothetical protein
MYVCMYVYMYMHVSVFYCDAEERGCLLDLGIDGSAGSL